MVKLTTKIASLKLFASYAIATYILVILTSALNLFKGYVADTFYIAETLLIVLTIILIIILTTEKHGSIMTYGDVSSKCCYC